MTSLARNTFCLCLLTVVVPVFEAAGAQVDAFWTSGTGNWNVAANWTPNVVPDNAADTYHVLIDNGLATASVATLNISPTIDRLTVSVGDTLSFINGADLEIAVGPIVNDGVISLNSAGSATELEIAASMSITGSGVILMSNAGSNFIENNDTATIPLVIHGAGHTIRGAGQIGFNELTLTNDGLIDADQTNPLTLDLAATGSNTNTGTLQSSASGTLDITNTILTNTDGLIQALHTSTVSLNSSSILGGVLHADPGSAISTNFNGTTLLQNITLTGLLRQDNGDDAVYEGTITNNGTISLNSAGSPTEIAVHPDGVTFTGTGEIVMSTNTIANSIDDTDAGSPPLMVHAATHTIRGAGTVGVNNITMINDGLIDANLLSALVLDLAATGPNTNTGTLQSSASGILDITGTILTNTDGVIQALGTSTVNLNSSSILGGVLHADPGSAISTDFNGTTFLQNVTLTGLLRQDNGDDARYEGTIINNGTIALNSAGSATEIEVHPNGVTFTGSGLILMSNTSANFIDDTDAGSPPLMVHAATHTIRGAGTVGVDNITMTNDGLIDANLSNALVLDLAATGPNTNTGTLQASASGILDITGTILTNTDGVIQALGTSTVNLNSSSILGGVLHADPGSAISTDFNGTTLLQNITLTGLLRQDNGDDARYEGTITNNGTIALNSAGSPTEIEVHPNGVTFTGTGEIVMSTNTSANFIDDTDAGSPPTLVNGPDHTIRGAGQIGVNAVHVTNQGAVVADLVVALAIDPPATGQGLLNSGILEAIGAGGITIAPGGFSTSGTVNVAAGSLISRTGAYTQTAGETIVNGTLSATTGVDIQGGVLSGGGTVSGVGSLVVNSGIVAPGDPIGTLTFNNGFTQNADGEIAIEIGGLTVGTQHDRLAVTGVANLDGRLSISFVNGFNPQIGDEFTIMTYASQTGDFDSFDAPCDETGAVQVDVGPISVRVLISDSVALADVNCDCVITRQDIQALVTALTNPAGFPVQFPGCDIDNADVNNDGSIDGRDVQPFLDGFIP